MIGTLGRGGMGGVVEVEDDAGARYALKSPVIDINASGDVTRRFAREANVLRLLDPPNLVAAVDVFVEAGLRFLVMEKVVGRTLAICPSRGCRRAVVDGAGVLVARG